MLVANVGTECKVRSCISELIDQTSFSDTIKPLLVNSGLITIALAIYYSFDYTLTIHCNLLNIIVIILYNLN